MSDGDVPATTAPLPSTASAADPPLAQASVGISPVGSLSADTADAGGLLDASIAGALSHDALSHDARPSLLRRAARHVRLEDVILFGWLIVQPIVFAPSTSAGFGDGRDLFAGLVDLAGMCGLAVCLIGRTAPGVRSGLVSGNDFAFAIGPLFGAIAFLLDDTAQRLGLSGDLGLAPIGLAVALGLVARLRLPPLSGEQRRFLVTPFILATSGFFGQFVGGFSDIFDLRAISDAMASPSLSGAASLVVGFGVAAVAVFYAMFVFAPRQIAEREGSPLTWIIRFTVFLIGLAIGTTLRAA